MAENYYRTLGVDKNASQDEIKNAYRKLVKQYHPDLHPNDAQSAAKFKEINEANETLSDTQKRAAYDYEQANPGRSNFGGGGFSSSGFGGFSDIFGDIFSQFGGNGAAQRDNSGEDVTINVELSFLDAAKGCSKEITYTRNEPCSECRGTGAKKGTAYKTCDKCKGAGQVQYVNNSGIFRTVSVRACDACGGTGKKIIEACDTCKGKGYIRKPTSIKLDIPAGADTGSYMKKRGYGEASKTGGEAGDLIIVFNVLSHKIFRRKNRDLYVELPISYKTAVLGGKIMVPTIDDTFIYSIPEGTQSGKVFYIKGKGIKTRSGTGDLYVTVFIEVPQKISRDQKKKLEDLNGTFEDKQYVKIKHYKENVESLYGVDPYSKD
jgi:molecular chaperone DnaJ